MGPLDLESTAKSQGFYKIFVQSLFRIVIHSLCIYAAYIPNYIYVYRYQCKYTGIYMPRETDRRDDKLVARLVFPINNFFPYN